MPPSLAGQLAPADPLTHQVAPELTASYVGSAYPASHVGRGAIGTEELAFERIGSLEELVGAPRELLIAAQVVITSRGEEHQ
jgi:hypothetical protein